MYKKPKIKIIEFQFEDVITRSEPPCAKGDTCGQADYVPSDNFSLNGPNYQEQSYSNNTYSDSENY